MTELDPISSGQLEQKPTKIIYKKIVLQFLPDYMFHFCSINDKTEHHY